MGEGLKRALVIVTKMDAGGAETVMMKYYRALDRQRYQLDFCVSDHGKGFYDEEIESLGGKIHYVAKKSEHPVKAFKDIRSVVRTYGYASVIRNASNAAASLDLLDARLGGARTLVFRSTTLTASEK